MRLYRLNHLPDGEHGHVFHGVVTGDCITTGELLFVARGRLACESEEEHEHETEEALAVLQGRATVRFADVDETLGPGDVMIVEAFERHHIESDPDDPCVLLYLHFGTEPNPNQRV